MKSVYILVLMLFVTSAIATDPVQIDCYSMSRTNNSEIVKRGKGHTVWMLGSISLIAVMGDNQYIQYMESSTDSDGATMSSIFHDKHTESSAVFRHNSISNDTSIYVEHKSKDGFFFSDCDLSQ